MASKRKQTSGINPHFILIGGSVVLGLLVTACQPPLMRNLDQTPVPAEQSPNMIETSPVPSGVPISGSEVEATGDTNAQIDASLKEIDTTMNADDPSDISGKDLN